MQIKVFSQEAFIDFLTKHEKEIRKTIDDIIMIRIFSSELLESPIDDVIFEEDFLSNQMLCFDFADVEDEFFENNKEALLEAEQRLDVRQSPITINEARKIKSFIERNKDKKLLLIHCEAGECRSWTVAFCIAKHILKDETLSKEIRNKVVRFSKTIERRFLEAWHLHI